MRRVLWITASCLVFVCRALGQYYPPIPVNLLSSDGNLYGANANRFYSYAPTTEVTTILNSAANGLQLCLERSDGTLLGINNPTSTTWQLVKVSLTGQLTRLAVFPATITQSPSCPALANDQNYYGASPTGGSYGDGFLYQLTAAGALNIFYNFTGQTDGYGPEFSPVQASDGNLYYFNVNELLRYNADSGLTVISLPYYMANSPQEGPGGDFYGLVLTEDGVTAIFQVSPIGTMTYLYDTNLGSEGYPTLSSLWVLDNELAFMQDSYYGIEDGYGCSVVGDYHQMFSLGFDGTPGYEITNVGVDESIGGGPADSDSYFYSFVLGGNSTFYGVYNDRETDEEADNDCFPQQTDFGPYSIQATGPSPTIQTSFNKTHVLPGGASTLTWDVENAYSDTMQQCYGYGGLSGKLPLSGSAIVTAPSAPGEYTSAIICGGTETATATLNVGNATLSLASSATVVAVGQSVTLSATVTNAATPAPTGTVQFLYGTQVIGSAALSSGVAKFTAGTTGLPVGTYAITAHYLGDANYGPANSSAVSIQLVARYPSTTSVSPSSQTVLSGANVALTGIVTGTDSAKPPTGTVTFMTGSTVLASKTISVTSGTTAQASLTASTAGLATGNYPVTVRYNGDAYNLASTSASASVTIAATVAKVSASPNPVPSGNSFTLTATVQGKVTPTGTVIFYDGPSQLASTSLNSSGIGTVTLSSGTLPSGSYSITVYYAGDANNGAVTSPAISLTVD